MSGCKNILLIKLFQAKFQVWRLEKGAVPTLNLSRKRKRLDEENGSEDVVEGNVENSTDSMVIEAFFSRRTYKLASRLTKQFTPKRDVFN